jgi:hypothetical protein
LSTELKIAIKRIFVTIITLTLLGQGVTVAFAACLSLPLDEPVSASDCHDHSAAVDQTEAVADPLECEHGCDSHCSGSSVFTGAPSVLSGHHSTSLVEMAADPLLPRLAAALFRPPISN